MSALQIFEDSDCTRAIDSTLFENRTYYLQFPEIAPALIAAALDEAGVMEYVGWQRLNRVATLRIVNRIGLLKLFGRVFDVRSEKLLEKETGQRQFKWMLDDLAELSRHIVFDYSSPTKSFRSHDTEAHTPSLLERFNYYRQVCFTRGKQLGIDVLVDRVIRSPHSKLIDEHVRDYIWNARRPSRQALRSFFTHKQTFCEIPEGHSLAKDRPGLPKSPAGNSMFPLFAMRSQGAITFNTPENRFVKHVLLDIEQVCLQVGRQGWITGALLIVCEKLLGLVRSLLRREFFRDVGKLDVFPNSSPTLVSKHGYREIYKLFLRSRVGAKHLFEDLAEESLFIDLKDVALLYEYWVFYKVAEQLLGPKVLVKWRDVVVKNGRLVNAIEVAEGDITIAFNKSFSRQPGGSYSLRLRPDVVVTIGKGSSARLLVLDAKYKSVDERRGGEELDSLLMPVKGVTAADIHKMHCYVDAIQGVTCAAAIYPGTQLVFYPRDRVRPPVLELTGPFNIEGVGAVPLIPGIAATDFEQFSQSIRLISVV